MSEVTPTSSNAAADIAPPQALGDDVTAPAPAAPKRTPILHKRKLGAGELIFDFGIYGGVSWILNEIVSTVIANSIYKADPAAGRLKDGLLHKGFEKTVDAMHTHLNPMKWLRTPFFLIAEMFMMTMGGHLMILLSKPAEDRKGSIVRWIDNALSGGKGEADPGIKRAHEEMDAAPKQSWFSQIWGRVLVVATAISQHFIMGAEGPLYTAPTTHWLKNTPLEKYSNLKRIMTTGTRDLLSATIPFTNIPLIPGVAKEQRDLMRANRAASTAGSEFLWMQPKEGKLAMLMGNTFGYVLIVSATMATLFFAASHVIAGLRDNHNAKRREQEANRATHSASTIDLETDPSETPPPQQPQQPKPQISAVQGHALLQAPSHELQVSA